MAKNTTKPHFSKKEAIDFGFELAKKNLFFFVGIFLVILLISIVMGALRLTLILGLVLLPVQVIIDLIVGAGLIYIALKFLDNKKPTYKDLFYGNSIESIVNYFLTSFLVGLIVIGGLILLIIPGIYFAFRLKFASYLVIDKKLDPVNAVKASWRMTKGNVWNLFFLGILLGFINLLGLLCLVIGLFITVPLSMLATAFVYRKLLLQSKAA